MLLEVFSFFFISLKQNFGKIWVFISLQTIKIIVEHLQLHTMCDLLIQP